MAAEKKTPTGDESVGAKNEQAKDAGMTTHEQNHAVRRPADKPSFDGVEFLARAGYVLIPLRDGSKAPRDKDWPNRRYDPAALIAEARARGGNLGVRLRPADLVVDVDPRNGGDESLARLVADTGLDLERSPHVITGGGGHHYYLRKPPSVATMTRASAYPGIDFKTVGGQVVAPGAVHPETGSRYESEFFLLGPDETPAAPTALLELLQVRRLERPEGSGHDRWGELTPELLRLNLKNLDVEEFRDHDAWRELMMACHHATAGEGRQEFIDWSIGGSGYEDHAEVIGKRWDSLHASASNGGRPITVARLFDLVIKAGKVPTDRLDPEDDFDAWEDPSEHGRGVDDAVLRAEPKAEGLDAVMEEMNAAHCVVMEGGKFRIFTEEMDPVLNRPFFQRSTKEDFQNLYLNDLVERPNEKPVPKAQFWLRHPKRRQYKGVIFDPSREHEDWLNLWRGWAVQPKKGDWSLLRQLILEVLVDGDEGHFEYVLDWIAYMFQYPDRVAEVALCFKGKKGTGKGTLGRALSDLAGSHGLHISSPSHLTGRFNSHLQNCICLFSDEAFWAGDKAGESVLKQLVTEPTMTYEGKGRDAVKGKNLVHIVMASNNDWVVPAGLGDERRFAVFEVNDRRRGDKAFFRALNRQLDEGGRAALLHDMLGRDLGDWVPSDNVPSSGALDDQKISNLDLEHEWWLSLLQPGERPTDDLEGAPADELVGNPTAWGDEPARVLCETLRDSYRAYAKDKRRAWKSDDALGKFIKSMGVEKEQIGTKRYRNKYCYVLPPFDRALQAMADTLGVGADRLRGK